MTKPFYYICEVCHSVGFCGVVLLEKMIKGMKMKKEIPDFLIEMSRQMNEQPNRCTAHPFWQVRCKRYLVTEEGYNESHWEICDTDDGTTLYHSENDDSYKELFEYIFEHEAEWLVNWIGYECDKEVEFVADEIDGSLFDELQDLFEDKFNPDWHDLPDTIKKFHMQEIEQVVTTHMTQADAEWFIKRKQHDYPPLYTYVESAYWSPQLRELQDWIISLTK